MSDASSALKGLLMRGLRQPVARPFERPFQQAPDITERHRARRRHEQHSPTARSHCDARGLRLEHHLAPAPEAEVAHRAVRLVAYTRELRADVGAEIAAVGGEIPPRDDVSIGVEEHRRLRRIAEHVLEQHAGVGDPSGLDRPLLGRPPPGGRRANRVERGGHRSVEGIVGERGSEISPRFLAVSLLATN
jgi:hypothetical protein